MEHLALGVDLPQQVLDRQLLGAASANRTGVRVAGVLLLLSEHPAQVLDFPIRLARRRSEIGRHPLGILRRSGGPRFGRAAQLQRADQIVLGWLATRACSGPVADPAKVSARVLCEEEPLPPSVRLERRILGEPRIKGIARARSRFRAHRPAPEEAILDYQIAAGGHQR